MTLSILHKGIILVAVPLAFQAGFAWAVAQLARQQDHARAWSLHTKVVIRQTQQVLTLLLEAQAGMRGYLLASDPVFAEPYHRVRDELPSTLQHLRTLVRDNPGQESLARSLTDQSNQFLQYLGDNLRDAQQGRTAVAIQRVKSFQGNQLMDGLRAKISEFLEVEDTLDRQRSGILEGARRDLTLLLISGTGVSIGLTGLLALVFWRGIRQRIGVLEENARCLELDRDLPPPLTGADEAARVDRAFHQMANALRQATARERAHMENLERRVAERTAALSAANDELGRHVRRFHSLVTATSQIVWTADADGEPQDVAAWSRFTGLTPEQMRREGWLAALHPDDRQPTIECWRQAQTSGVFACEYRLHRADGVFRDMRVHGVPIRDEQERLVEWVGVCEDVTEKRRAEAEVRQFQADLERRVHERTAQLNASNKELEAFSYSVSHDLRAPLRAMDGFARILTESFAHLLPDKARHYLRRVQENAQQMGRLVDDLLSFSRLARQPLVKVSVDMSGLVRQVLTELRHLQDDREIEIVVKSLPDCRGEPALLKQLFINLLDNAFKFTGPRPLGRIEIGSHSDDTAPNRTVYYVKDNGVGFDMRYAGQLFGVFQRLHRADEFKGTGVGLAIVQRVVQRHGGRVWAESELGHGAAFYFTLEGTPS